MAEVPVTIVGVVAPMGKASGDQPYPAVITGKASITGLGIGGGPMPGGPSVGHPIAPGGPPPGIWPPPGVVSPPIYYPPGIWPPPGGPVYPAHPIVLPPVDIPPPEGEEEAKWQVQTYWTPQNGWAVAIVPAPGHPGVPTPAEKK